MCIILDADHFSKFQRRDKDMQPVRRWLDRRNGKIIFSDTKKFRDEWAQAKPLAAELARADQIEVVSQGVAEKENELKGKIESNDEHIVALAIVAGVKVLVSSDQALHKDFKNPNLVGGKVYQKKSHVGLLRDTCS
ncbi:hypothetical protein F4X33_16770 [Candidatus Poribacteria bacterium]|nr:hypothetical protein [Candidatus Poribacteria bacterium]